MSTFRERLVIPAELGWANPDTGPENLRLYAGDISNPRWAQPHARVAEQPLMEQESREGDRFLIVRVGDRFTPDEAVEAIRQAILGMTL